MPKIRAETLEDHHAAVWGDLIAGLERLLATRSYEEISISDIAASAGMARNTVYNYAPDKATLVATAANKSNQRLLEQVTRCAEGPEPVAERLEAILTAIVSWFGAADHRNLVLVTLFRPTPQIVRETGVEPLDSISPVVAGIIAEGIEAGVFRPVGDIDLVVELMSGVSHYAATRVIRAPEQVGKVVAEVNAFVMAALGCERVGAKA
ncbi:MAG TPA: TetR/AcrR family transcriptional regulator [Novosphingobium sp.]|nr:TetR/AcrR family transcriptional regulator [Novosphingobium sp.]